MRFARHARPGPRAALTAAAALAVVLGCAHVATRPPAPPSAGRPAARSAPAGAQTPGAGAPGTLDPSEVMTPEELATIPDPVPQAATAADSAPATVGEGRAPVVPPAADLSARSPGAALDGAPGARAGGSAVWRVQIFASPDLKLADRQAKEASARLGVRASIEFEGQLYKVRLGDFATDEEAQALRERAVREGYPGAFRVRTTTTTSNDTR